jgi:hypothetical protein
MTGESSDPSVATQRLREMLAGAVPVVRTDAHVEHAPRTPSQAPTGVEQKVSEPERTTVVVEHQVLREEERPMPLSQTDVLRTSPELGGDSQTGSNEKLRVLEGFHRWVTSKATSVGPAVDNPAAMQQLLSEIIGAAGFVSALMDGKE